VPKRSVERETISHLGILKSRKSGRSARCRSLRILMTRPDIASRRDQGYAAAGPGGQNGNPRFIYPTRRQQEKERQRTAAGTWGTEMIQLKRAYDPPSSADGIRFLIERLWPRGLKKISLRLDAWLKEAGPRHQLRKWFGHDPKKWNEFRLRYFRTLRRNSIRCRPRKMGDPTVWCIAIGF